MHVADLNKSRESAAADSHLNHVLKNKIILIDHWIELTRKDIARRSPSGAAPAAAEGAADTTRQHAASGPSRPTPPLRVPVGTADRMLADAQQVLQGCVTWIHCREFFMQLARGVGHSPGTDDRPRLTPRLTRDRRGECTRLRSSMWRCTTCCVRLPAAA